MNVMAESSYGRNIIAIASGKGGVGKTWLSVTLSQLFARSGRKILLFDGDIGLANVDVQLGLTPQKDLSQLLRGTSKIEDIITHYPMGFDIIAGRSGSISLANITYDKLLAVKQQLLNLSKQYDYVIIDLGAGIEQYVQFMAAMAGNCIVVVTDEPTSLTDSYAFIKLYINKLKKTQINIVVNQATTQKEGERTFEALHKACNSFLKINPELIGIIRKDNKVRDSIRAQAPIIEKSPNSIAAMDAATISIKLLQKI